MHVCKLGLFYMRGVFSCWCLHTDTQTKWIQWWPVLVYFLPQISIVFVIFFLSYLFFIVDWSLYSVTWWWQGLEQFSPHHVTHSELFNKYGLAIKVPLVLYFSPLKMLYIDSIDALAFWTVLQISEEGKAWYEQNIQSIFLMPEAPWT